MNQPLATELDYIQDSIAKYSGYAEGIVSTADHLALDAAMQDLRDRMKSPRASGRLTAARKVADIFRKYDALEVQNG